MAGEAHVKRAHRSIATAPKDGSVVWINTFYGEFRAAYLDCEWLRETNPEVLDCWRPVGPNPSLPDDNDIELKDALGWRPYVPVKTS
jgi:hypothetical protein